MDIIKCDECGWCGDMQDLEAHFYGEHEISICPKCNSEKISDIPGEEK